MFFYCIHSNYTPTEPFSAWKVDGELYPDNGYEKGKIFVPGKGYKKKSGKEVTVPLIPDLTAENVQAHFNEYGKYCTFYAITGYDLFDQDCCAQDKIQEFKSAVICGFDYVAGCVEKIQQVNRKIRDILMDRYGLDIRQGACWAQYPKTNPEHLVDKDKLFFVKPYYSLMFYIITAPSLDVIHDDDRLWKHYVAINGINHKDKFPVQMKARLTFLFNKEVTDDYEFILHNYGLNYQKTK